MYYNYDVGKTPYYPHPHHQPGIMPHFRLAEAYVPYQMYRCFYPLPEGFDKGTIFQELYRPYVPKQF